MEEGCDKTIILLGLSSRTILRWGGESIFQGKFIRDQPRKAVKTLESDSLATRPWGSYFTSLNQSFLISKMRNMFPVTGLL